MSDAICYCGSKMDIKTSRTYGMDGSYTNWTLRCPRCGIIKEYAADGFYGREYLSSIDNVINDWNRNKAACLKEGLCTKENTKE